MAEARRCDAWDHTAHLLCVLINANRDPKKGSAVKVEDCHPFASRQKAAAQSGDRVVYKPSEIAKMFGMQPGSK